jgi:hypothetical protein
MKPSHPERSEGSLCGFSAGAAPFAVKGAVLDFDPPPSLTIVILNEAPCGAPSAPQPSEESSGFCRLHSETLTRPNPALSAAADKDKPP